MNKWYNKTDLFYHLGWILYLILRLICYLKRKNIDVCAEIAFDGRSWWIILLRRYLFQVISIELEVRKLPKHDVIIFIKDKQIEILDYFEQHA